MRTAIKQTVLFGGAGFRFLVNGSWNSAVTTAPASGVFLAVDNLNFSAFGTTTDIAMYDDGDDSIEYGLNIDASGNVDVIENGSVAANNVLALSTSTNYDFVIALQADKTAHYFVYNSTQAAWRRFWVGTFITSATLLYANDATTGATYTTTVERFGAGMLVETPAIDIASPQVGDGSVSGGDPVLPDADFVMQFTLDTLQSSGSITIQFRYQDNNNYWRVRINSAGSLILEEVVSGTPIVRASTSVLSGGEVVTLIARGNTITGYYNSTQAWSYASANNFLRNTDWAVSEIGTGGVISNLKIWKAYARSESGLGSELVTNGGFDTDTAWTKGTGWTISGGTANHAAGIASILSQVISLNTSKYYLFTFNVSNRTAGNMRPYLGGSITLPLVNSNGSFSFYGIPSSSIVQFDADTNFDGSIDNVSVKEVQFIPDALGNKLNQAVS